MRSETLVTGIYVLATVFGVGVTSVELLGLLGDWDDGSGGHDGGGADDGGGAGHVAHDGDGGHARGHDAQDDDHGHAYGRSNLPVQQPTARIVGRPGRQLFAILWYLRLTVYFSLGFGPLGLVAILLQTSVWASIAWAAGSGLVTMLAARSFFRFQRREFDSTVTDGEILGRAATVTIAIYPGEFGRVRIELSQLVLDRYARSESDDATFHKGEQVVIAGVDEDGVRVRAADEVANPQAQTISP